MAPETTTPGLLYVTMQPKPGLSTNQFHEWYNNEHGPARLRLPSIFANGLRYAATDGAEPTFLAVYDVTSTHHLSTPTYTSLRDKRSPREAETIAQVDVQRTILDLAASNKSPAFVPAETRTDKEAEGQLLVSVELLLKDDAAEGGEEEVLAWYTEEHFELVAKIPGWLRSRVYRPRAAVDGGGGPRRIFALHEFSDGRGLGGPEHQASTATPLAAETGRLFAERRFRTYSLFYVFGPAPRDLEHLHRLPAPRSFSSVDGTLTTEAGPDAAIMSRVNTPDGLDIPYRLEGNPSATAPTIAFSNSLLTSLHMWDALVAILKRARPDVRILRYDTRGRHGSIPAVPATLDMLADDLASLLDALRIPRLHALVGVSMGGATTLAFALRHPTRLDRFVACDFNAASSGANTAAWKERIALAQSSSPSPDKTTTGMQALAAATVERWFHPDTPTQKPELARRMTEMVAANDVDGFRLGCQALWDYDLKDRLRGCTVPGLLVVGEGDGKGALVKAMEGFRGLVGEEGVELRVVPSTGHLPMFEDPAAFWERVRDFL